MSRKNTNSSRMKSRAVNERLAYEWKWRTIVEKIALSRFQWNDLPEGVSERYLERTLLLYGQAVFFKFNDIFMATQLMTEGNFNVYHDPTKLVSISDNGWHYRIPEDEGVIVWDSLSRRNQFSVLEMFIQELAEIDVLARVNRRQQRNLAIIQGPEERSSDLNKLMNDLEMGEWAKIALPTMNGQENEVKSIKLDIPYMQDDFHEDRTSTLNSLYSVLGIEHIPFEKSERMITAEASIATDSIARMREDSLVARQHAADELNKLFGLNISVEWRTNQKELIEGSYGEDEHSNSEKENKDDR